VLLVISKLVCFVFKRQYLRDSILDAGREICGETRGIFNRRKPGGGMRQYSK